MTKRKRDYDDEMICDGTESNWRRWRHTTIPALIIEKDKEQFMRMDDPATRDRITRGYRAGENDPTGALPGEWVSSESPRKKRRKERYYQEDNRKLWAKVAKKLRDRAATVADQARPKQDFKALLRALDAAFEIHGDNATFQMLRDFAIFEKQPGQSVDEHFEEWSELYSKLEANGMGFNSKVQQGFYMNSLGKQFQIYRSIVAQDKTTKHTLASLKKGAQEQPDPDNDEHDNSQLALMAAELRELKAKQRAYEAAEITKFNGNSSHIRSRAPPRTTKLSKAEMNKTPCVLCSSEHHSAAGCFREGGGLAWMDEKQREAHIQHGRLLRGYPATKGNNSKDRSHADSAIERPKSQIFLADREEDRHSDCRSEYSYECQAADLAHELAETKTKLAEEKTKHQLNIVKAKEFGLELED